MPESRSSDRRFLWGALAAAAFIVYGSLYPFQFHAASLSEALQALLSHYDMHSQPLSGLVANIALYMPLGLFLAATVRSWPSGARVVCAGSVGLILSVAMELIQFMDSGRVTTLTDVLPNGVGTVIGAVLAGLLAQWFDTARPGRALRAEPVALLLLVLYLVYRLYPYVPSIDLAAWYHTARPALAWREITFFHVLRYATLWWVAGVLLSQLRGRADSRLLLPVAIVLVLSAKIVIAQIPVTASELVGAAIAVAAWPVFTRLSPAALSALILLPLIAVVLGERLLPFDWSAQGDAFGWVPFVSILHGSMGINLQSMAEKAFLYGSLIWLAHRGDAPLVLGGWIVAAGLLGTSVLATHLPGHSAETTDALIALAMTGVFRLILGERDTRVRRRRHARLNPYEGDPMQAIGPRPHRAQRPQ